MDGAKIGIFFKEKFILRCLEGNDDGPLYDICAKSDWDFTICNCNLLYIFF